MTRLAAPANPSAAQPLQPGARGYVVTFTVAAVVVAAVTWSLIEHEHGSTLAYWEGRESAAAEVMASRVSDWLRERRADADVFASAAGVKAAVAGRLSEPGAFNAWLWQQFNGFLAQAAAGYGYRGIYVLNAAGAVILRSANAPPLEAAAPAVARRVAHEGNLRLDLYGDVPERSVASFTAPVVLRPEERPASEAPRDPAAGSLMLIVSLADSLFPLLESETLRGETCETYLVRRDGNEIVYITPLRHRPEGSSQLRLPVGNAPHAARLALMGRPVAGEYSDYRGVAVIAAVRPIPQTGWGLVYKIDSDEALADFRVRARLEAGIACLLLLAIAAFLRGEWQRQRMRLLAVRVASAEARQQLAAIVHSSADAIISKTLDGIITSWNPGAEELYGYTAAEAIGQPLSILVPPDHRDEISVILDRIKCGERVAHFDTARLRKDGQRVDVSVTVSPIIDETGTIVGASTIARDISERKRLERELQANALYTRSLIEASLDPLVTINADGKITDVNIATEQVTGVARAQLIGSDFSDYFTEPEQARAGYRAVFTEGTVRDYPLTIRHTSGRTSDVLYNATTYRDAAGQVQGVFAAARDITGRKRAEEALRRSNVELQQFAYVASHDLQEPLRMVASYVELLARRYKGRIDADADDFIRYAVDGATRMQALINDLLTYSRLGSHAAELASTDCERVLNDVLANLRETIAASGAVVTRDPLPTVIANDQQLGQVLQNLIGNAIKFRGQAPPRVHIRAERRSGAWQFAVRDNGIGIDPEHFERIFVIFQRLHGREAYPGTGLGLAICKRIIEQHGGRIWVESEPGTGSTFSFTIPAASEAVARPVAGDGWPATHAGDVVTL